MRLALALAAAVLLEAQTFTQRGFIDTRATLYPQAAPGDSGHAVGEALIRWEPSLRVQRDLAVYGSVDARVDTHRMVERKLRFDWQDRRIQRPALSLRRLSAQWHRGGVTVEAGKQFIRWGKADILNPLDRFAPRDYLSVVDNDFLGVTAGRVTVERGSETLDLVVSPRFTPARTPLLNQRWVVVPPELSQFRFTDLGPRIPGRTQFGARWNHNGRGYEFSAVFYDGFHYLPLLDPRLNLLRGAIEFERFHPSLRLYGADAAVPLPWFTVKAETAWFRSRTTVADEYVLYVVQIERTWGEWVVVGGYGGEAVTARRNPFSFAPDRGLARSFLGRAQYTIDSRRTLAFETAVRQNGDGVWWKSEYSQQFGAHWRGTAGFTLIRGKAGDFLGQFRLNSHGVMGIRYSF
ncbi:MAG: hypothetical protein FJW39_05620 [Acidobacteria bacterium]|nr:hypothetical protein [Acidobacteriota bacterium]